MSISTQINFNIRSLLYENVTFSVENVIRPLGKNYNRHVFRTINFWAMHCKNDIDNSITQFLRAEYGADDD
jgi:hypothetical protein